jgi:ankyrin repeat protein
MTDPTIILKAAETCSPLVLQKLLDAGAEINVLAVDKSYPTLQLGSPLQAACLSGKRENISFLLKKSADANLGAGRFENPLSAAIHCVGHSPANLPIIEELFSYGASPKTPGVLHKAVWQTASWNPKRSQALDIIRSLLRAGVDVNSLNTLNETALFQAAQYGAEDAVALLLANSAKLAVGKSPLQAAVSGDHVGVLRLLKEIKK